jgi:protein-S-isoprenylcysteine O-methyltransferase Ste14
MKWVIISFAVLIVLFFVYLLYAQNEEETLLAEQNTSLIRLT